jgi:hypothetical protein
MIDVLGAIAVWCGLGLLLIGGLFFIIAAFRESILWGLGVLFLPFVSLVFLILAWPRAKGPFFLQLYGVILVLIGVFALSAHLPLQHRY